MKLGEEIYKAQQEAEQAGEAGGDTGAAGVNPDEDVVDADFEEVDDDDDKNKGAGTA